MRIAEGAEASAGDLVICRAERPHSRGRASRAGAWRTGTSCGSRPSPATGIQVRRLLEPDPATGQRRFTGRAFCYRGYSSCDLAYAVTGHSAQGGTVHTGITLVTGGEDRQWLYAALTRGTDNNLVFVSTTPAKVADPATRHPARPRTGPVRAGPARTRRATCPPSAPALPGGPDPREPIAVLADILDRDGAQLSATRDPGSQPGQRRPPRCPGRDLGRRNQASPGHPLPGPGYGRASRRVPARTVPSGPVAVPDAALGGAGRPGPGRGRPVGGRFPGPGRRARHRHA